MLNIIYQDAWFCDIDDYEDFFSDFENPLTDEDKMKLLYDWQEEEFYDIIHYDANKETDGRILAIANLGLWHGQRAGYKVLGYNLNEIFNGTSGDGYCRFYSDGYNIRGEECHHDGTNYYLYREIREDRNIENFLNSIYNGEEITRSKLNYYTKSIAGHFNKLYGWKGIK